LLDLTQGLLGFPAARREEFGSTKNLASASGIFEAC